MLCYVYWSGFLVCLWIVVLQTFDSTIKDRDRALGSRVLGDVADFMLVVLWQGEILFYFFLR
jgi:hypothetical protein